MVEERFPTPPPLSLPREVPWRELEEIIDGLRAVASKLDILYMIYTGVAPPTVVVPPPEVVVPPPTVIVAEMPAIPPPVVIPPAPTELAPITIRLDDLRRKFDTLLALYAWANAPVAPAAIPAPPELTPITARLDILISALVRNFPTFATGQKDVTTAGVPEQLDDWPIPDGCKLTVIARTDNTGYIYLGKNKSDCANSKRRFDGLEAGVADSRRVKNASAVWVDASVDGEGVSWIVEAIR